MAWCLIKEKADKFKQMLISGKISPALLYEMSSKERIEFFTENFGEENATQINALYESKLLLKNQQRGIIKWAEQVMKTQPKVIDRSSLTKIERLEKAMSEKELDDFLESLVEKKIGFHLEEQEFKDLSILAKDAQEKKQIALSKLKNGKWQSNEDKVKYGLDFGFAKVAYEDYYSELANKAKGGFIKNVREAYKNRGIYSGTGVLTSELFNLIAENSRAFVASWDNSFWGRQGRKAMLRPATSKLWLKNFNQSFIDATNILIKGKKVGNNILNAVKAEIYSRENYLNGKYTMGKKLDIGVREEDFPTSLPEKIPALGRLFKMSEVTYTAGAMRLRTDIADMFYKIAENNGINTNESEEIGAINEIVNIMTGRGALGSFEQTGKELNKVFFAPKFAMSQIQTLTKPKTAKTQFVRKQAALNLLSLAISTGIIMSMFKFLWPERTELDPRSSNFSKIKIGNQWVDITGGLAPYIVLFSRILPSVGGTKSTQTGIVKKLNDGFGSNDGVDLIFNFLENKTSPIGNIIKDLIKGQTFEGDKITFFKELSNLLTPIVILTGKDAYEQNNMISDLLIAMIADGLGFSVSQSFYKINWNNNTSKELTQFKEKVGQEKFDEANDLYNKELAKLYVGLINDNTYLNLNDEDKQKYITKKKEEIKDNVLKKYNFKYKK